MEEEQILVDKKEYDMLRLWHEMSHKFIAHMPSSIDDLLGDHPRWKEYALWAYGEDYFEDYDED